MKTVKIKITGLIENLKKFQCDYYLQGLIK